MHNLRRVARKRTCKQSRSPIVGFELRKAFQSFIHNLKTFYMHQVQEKIKQGLHR